MSSTYIPATPSTTQPPTDTTQATVVTASTPTAHASSGLPVTGGDLASLALIGAVAFAAGTVLVRRFRKST